ncbi:hypothetical protein [Blastopirellula marina]|uniref:Uncharacterized protein n=1 Tax=Blastopirellula marina TaxID=124 RepID=A0A2S8GB78_9BACT|nr:hypothetical protein [Blastopirellula marina]PQO41531.1 hypothetical protein C5Y93_30955 [Blastopirellula marina]
MTDDPTQPTCPNCRLPMSLPADRQTGEIACPVCTMALYFVRLSEAADSEPFLIRQGQISVAEWREICRCVEQDDSVSAVEAVMLLEEYLDR